MGGIRAGGRVTLPVACMAVAAQDVRAHGVYLAENNCRSHLEFTRLDGQGLAELRLVRVCASFRIKRNEGLKFLLLRK